MIEPDFKYHSRIVTVPVFVHSPILVNVRSVLYNMNN